MNDESGDDPGAGMSRDEQLEAIEPAAQAAERLISRDPTAFDEVWNRMSSRFSAGATPQGIMRRRLSFVVDHELCEPGTFGEDFELTITSLSSAQEMAAAREADGDPMSMAFGLAQRSICSINGRALSRGKGEVEMLWEWLGSPGRNLVATMFTDLAAPSKGAAKKAQDSLRVHT